MPAPEFLTPDEVAARWRVHPSTVRRYVRSGALRAVHLGRTTIRIPLDAVEAVEAPDEVAA